MNKFAFFSADGLSFPVALHMQQAGHDVYVGQVRDFQQIQMKRKEKPEERERRLSLYDGMLENKWDAQILLKHLLKQPRKQDWLVFCEMAYLFPIADQLRRVGFYGLLPHKEDNLLERDRRYAKQFVKDNYPHVAVAEYQEFKRIEDAKKFLDKHAEEVYALKGYSDNAHTIVPARNDPKINRELILDSLERGRKDYESEGFLLERKIPDVIEFTPAAIAYDGQVIGVDCDVEHKLLGSRGGPQEGCSICLVFQEQMDGLIYEYFLEPLAEKMLRPNELTYWDLSVYYSKEEDKFFFGEFCIRPGYDSALVEMAMCGGAPEFFENVERGDLFSDAHQFGTSVRVFNVHRQSDGRYLKELIIADPTEPNLWLWDCKMESGKLYTAGLDQNTYVVTAAANSIDDAIQQMYETENKVEFDSGLSLEEHDFHDISYPGNILHRYEVLQGLTLDEGEAE